VPGDSWLKIPWTGNLKRKKKLIEERRAPEKFENACTDKKLGGVRGGGGVWEN